MRTTFFTTLLLGSVCGVSVAAADPVAFNGVIGPYEVEALLETVNGSVVSGRYRYAGRDAWLSLSGAVFDRDALSMIETVDGVDTGEFFLEFASNGLTGFWVAGDTSHPVTLVAQNASMEAFLPIKEVEAVGPGVTGRYAVGSYWVNDWFAPNYEIGFNGGEANVVQIDENRAFITFEFIVGPTYHIASFQQLVERTDESTFVFSDTLYGGDEACTLIFSFSDAALSISDENTSGTCGFGARAHANFDLEKVSDTAEFHDQW